MATRRRQASILALSSAHQSIKLLDGFRNLAGGFRTSCWARKQATNVLPFAVPAGQLSSAPYSRILKHTTTVHKHQAKLASGLPHALPLLSAHCATTIDPMQSKLLRINSHMSLWQSFAGRIQKWYHFHSGHRGPMKHTVGN